MESHTEQISIGETQALESLRRCKDCRRIVTESAGTLCPWCGSEALIAITLRQADASRQSQALCHPAIVAFSMTIVSALMILRIFLYFFKGQQLTAALVYSEMLWQLQTVTLAATGLHLMLRRSEGDFRALFIVSLLTFLATEGLAALSRSYGITTLARLLIPFNLALFTYSGLALTAAVADGFSGNKLRRVLLAASGCFLTISIFRAVLETKSTLPAEYISLPATLVLGAVTAYVAWLLLRKKAHVETAEDPRLR